jgi:mevalonate kinase
MDNYKYDYKDIFNIITEYYLSYKYYEEVEKRKFKKKFDIVILELKIKNTRKKLRKLFRKSQTLTNNDYQLMREIESKIQNITRDYIRMLFCFRESTI